MHPLIQELVTGGPVVTDGALGTELQRRGLRLGEAADGWNLTRPDAVAEVARAYVEAGSRIILTNTFGANHARLGQIGMADRVEEINRAGVEISRRAAGLTGVRVFGSMGPCGKTCGRGELESVFVEQATILAGAGVEGIVVETMVDLEEARVAVSAAHGTGLPVVGCMVFDNRERTLKGIPAERVAQELAGAGADVVGANCGEGLNGLAELCRCLQEGTRLPIWVKPNAGMPEIVDGRAMYRVGAEEFAGAILEVVKAGAVFVGGCCGAGPEFIRAIRRVLG